MSEDYTYYGYTKVGSAVITVKSVTAAELDALREQMVKLADMVTRLETRLQRLEQAQRPQAVNVVTVVDWED